MYKKHNENIVSRTCWLRRHQKDRQAKRFLISYKSHPLQARTSHYKTHTNCVTMVL